MDDHVPEIIMIKYKKQLLPCDGLDNHDLVRHRKTRPCHRDNHDFVTDWTVIIL